jgi:hypothetical protein
MPQIHNNFTDEEVKQLLLWYEAGVMNRAEVMDRLGVRESRFFELLRLFRKSPSRFTVSYGRKCANRQLPPSIMTRVRRELEVDKRLIQNPNMPIMFYNYASIRDAVEEQTGYPLTAQTVINYAKKWGFYVERPKKRASHTREVITNHTGMLLQHDASTHQWSPYARDSKGTPIKWSLITTLDDHSRKILYAGMFEREGAWPHIQALESVVMNYGVGVRYYSDNHSIFRYVASRDRAVHKLHLPGTDDIAPQWKQCVEATGMKVTYAMSPEAKGKIERPYRWMQDRIVRRAARNGARTIDEIRDILDSEIDRYNNRQVHSATGEIPSKRFEQAVSEGRSCFRPFDPTKAHPPVTSTKDIFCLRTERTVNGYGRITLGGLTLDVPGELSGGTKVSLHIIPSQHATEVRFLFQDRVLGYTVVPTLA